MASSDALLPISAREEEPLCPYTRLPMADPNQETHGPRRRRPFKGLLAVSFGLLFIAFYVALIATHDGSRSNDEGIDETETITSRARLAGVSEKRNDGLWKLSGDRNTPAFEWNNSMLSWQRTAFHFQPEQNWMNDPNGPLFYKGWYHFFYQYNPNAAVWGDIVWGHAVSRDLIHWVHLPIAMVADQWYDSNGVWTGSATFLPDGSIVMLYTGSTDKAVQVQNLAYPEDPNDPLLLKWVKFPGNPVLVPPPGILPKDFRDPTTAWKTSEGKWRITIGSKLNKTGISLVYDTIDFKTYEKLDTLLHRVPNTGMWECVDFYPVSKTAGNGLDTSVNGPDVKHIVKASMDDTRFDHYAVGTYFDSNGTWIPDDPTIDVGMTASLRYDYGKFYASKSFYDQNKGRRVLWSWIGESDSEASDVQKGWSSLQGIPRTVVLDTKTGKNLVQWPVEEIKSLRLSSKQFDLEVGPGSVVPVDVGSAAQLDIEAEFEINKESLDKIIGNASVVAEAEEFSCEKSGGSTVRGALGPFGFSVLATESLSEQTPVYFYVAKGKDSELKTFFCTDTSRSSVANDVVKPIYGSVVPVLKGEKLTMRILVDHSIVEAFGQGGRTCITSRVYPTTAIYGAAKLFLFNNALDATVTASFTVWQMNSAFIHPYSDEAVRALSRT
ncbi:beta-fructosidase [Arabidopsis thaliana]|uniref:Acid beta-fructofuranosidase 4, vacuolar n=2 Tax=Arabidopsis thaliana TaxID=3702 RepID=INVA4_ARATH|nr:Glycosyl hydrolases family 32 protein [Arabidopsis thaliana]Q39041.2 RecName: Full=Acid beta-fructofuranosidase 4, vacuolar; Short=At beta fruct4; Short=AtBETAFRUCT4; AltName: Full=Acid invertase 4; Short=AI 4; AltName: Full=Acid sucrose hydrolase 4; AltName: Full=Vacuolar invertase 4; Short=Inv-V4; Short=VAC-INV 4; Short=VI 4; Flags: Precursor [Arabidopsis thaliana]AAG12569.1 beta-fructosidase [Arabidopsis thaliana]AAK76683.1 putative beta-fructosidase [Arabidopsis thaliana]AAN13204.1 putat|eukprot:NP_563901.1 Glycosyl hydrolases family 32 protein [Arabidopsis thaliana]